MLLEENRGLVGAGEHDLRIPGGRANNGRLAPGGLWRYCINRTRAAQYTGEHFQKLLDEQGITCSMSRTFEDRSPG